MPQKRIPTLTRFLSKVTGTENPDGCWPWTGGHDKDGYGIFWDGTYWPNGRGHYVRVPRWVYAQFVGPLPDDRQVLHRCDNPPCVNPAHLFVGTAKDNHADREAKGRGRRAHGSEHVGSKLTEAQVLTIRASDSSGTVLAEQYGVHSSLIYRILTRQIWTHI